MKIIDLHTHTTFSDGSYTPEQLMVYAVKKGLAAIAVTDHDSIDSYEQSCKWAKLYNIEFVPGVEIETAYENIDLHILGYYIDPLNVELLKLLENSQKMRHNRNIKITEILNKEGIAVSLEEVRALAGHEIVSKIHFAKLMMNKGYCDSIWTAMKEYLGRGAKAYVKRPFLPPEKTFDIIKNAGGVPVLAHPISYRIDYTREEAMIKELKTGGLAGIEAIYPTNSPEDTERYIGLAKKYSLLVTGGSDFHGSFKPGLDLGTGYGELWVDYSVLEGLKKHAGV